MALAAGGVGSPAAATSDDVSRAPLRLVPPAAVGPAETSAVPAEASEAGGAAASETVEKRVGDIEVNPLKEIEPDSIGTLDPGAGGFGIEMWQGTDRQVVMRLLRRLPDNMNSPTMHSLTRRLLTSIAAPPRSQREGSAGEEASLLALRVERLMTLGEVHAVNDLLAVVPSRQDEEFIARTRVDALLLADDVTEACRHVRNGITVYHQMPYWQKAMVLCRLVAGEVDKMMLGLDLLRERGGVDDPLFFGLTGALFGTEPDIPADAQAAPLHLAMIRAIGVPPPARLVEQAPTALRVALARASSLDLEQRARAAESVCAKGLLEGQSLARLYEAFSFTSEELANPISAAEALEGPRARALLYQAAKSQSVPASRAEILRLALQHGERAGLYQALVATLLPLLADVAVTPELSWFATTAGRALYAAGRYEQASAWFMLGRQEGLINPQASTAAVSLWPYSRLAGGAALTTDGNLATWRAAREGVGDDIMGRRQTLLRAAFQALGERDPLPWSLIAADGEPVGRRAPNAALIYALEEASESRRLGETVLLSLIVLGEAGPGGSHAVALSTVLAALSRVGLEKEARALAIEAALANGI